VGVVGEEKGVRSRVMGRSFTILLAKPISMVCREMSRRQSRMPIAICRTRGKNPPTSFSKPFGAVLLDPTTRVRTEITGEFFKLANPPRYTFVSSEGAALGALGLLAESSIIGLLRSYVPFTRTATCSRCHTAGSTSQAFAARSMTRQRQNRSRSFHSND
jgi:hypothetical protein